MDDDTGIKVVLNGTVTSLPREIGFRDLTKIAFPDVVRTDLIEWEVDYQYADRPMSCELKPSGTLEVARGMKIHVSYTDKS